MPTQDILLSQKFNNYNYAPGIATYGIDGKTGQAGIDGNNIYFTDCNLLTDTDDDLKILAELIANNYLPVKGSTTQINRSYKNNDLFFDYNGIIYQLTHIDDLIGNKDIGGIYSDYFIIAGKINIADIDNVFKWVDDRMILNTSSYSGYDIVTINNPNNALDYINKDAAVNIISDKVNENSNIEMVKMQSIDDVDIEDGNLSVYYKTTENAFYLESNKPIVINGDIKLNNDNNTNNEYDNFSTILTSNDTVTYFKHICNKLEYTIIYDSSINQYKIVVYSTESEIDNQEKTIDYLAKRNETVFGKIYTNENDQILIKFEKAYNNDTPLKPYLFGYVPQAVSSITTFSLIHNTEVFLTYKEGGPSLDEIDLTKYSSLKLMKYNPFYYAFFNDPQVLVPDEQNYYEYVGETIMYPNEDGQLCYIWHKYEGKEDSVKLLTNSLNLSLPFNEKSPEFVATVNSDYTKADNYSDEVDLTNNIDENGMPTNYTIYKNNYSSTIKTHWNSKTEEFDIPIPEEYQGLRILRKTL